MAETHSIEKQGLLAVMEHLESVGRPVELSKRKTFDLVVDGMPAEVKCKQAPWSKVDFIGLTDHQRAALDAGENSCCSSSAISMMTPYLKSSRLSRRP